MLRQHLFCQHGTKLLCPYFVNVGPLVEPSLLCLITRFAGLENESRILTKRMSVASIVSADNTPRSDTPTKSSYISREQRATPAHAADPRKTSAIPRPSLHHTRSTQDSPAEPSAGSSSLNRTSPPGVTPQRSRTYSQPHSQDFTSPNGNANGSTLSASSDSRPTSPRTNDARPTRIPIATRNRTTSVSSHAQSIAPRAESRNGIFPGAYPSPNPDSSPDLYVLQEANLPPLSLRHQRSNLMNEPPPFSASSITSSLRSQEHLPTPREPKFSTDSEERPFEHWYRGDVHRNGGVGELRVAKHMEMLQIANFGHSIRQPLRSQTSPDYNRKRMRAESLSVGGRGSLCLDDDERAQGVDMVLDESPLTDIEADSDTDVETFYDAYMGNADEPIRSSFNVSMPMLPLSVAADTKNEASVVGHEPHLEDINPALVPMARAVSELRRPDTPPVRESTIPTPPPTVPRSQAVSRATSPVSQISVQSQARRRTKSPARPSPASTPKGSSKAKAKTPPVPRQTGDPRHSVAAYPTPEGDVVDAIPTWTQPVQKSGTWDDVNVGLLTAFLVTKSASGCAPGRCSEEGPRWPVRTSRW